jgi:hypothetical protein
VALQHPGLLKACSGQAISDENEADLLIPKSGKCRHPSGSGNYLNTDVKVLLGFVEAELPLSQCG